ncbi:MAG: hypothetical protein GY829_12670 [Gammaproteobacteria bacterium]|nr:hypothetical protein [Gammaproteobacteria bacterium]
MMAFHALVFIPGDYWRGLTGPLIVPEAKVALLIGKGSAVTAEIWETGMDESIGNINTLFSLFHQEEKEIHDAAQLWGIRNPTDFRRPVQVYSSQPACR